jgi:hypothetical protein
MGYDDDFPQTDADERFAELADLLAAGLQRLRLKTAAKSSKQISVGGKSLLDGSVHQSMHGHPKTQGIPT